MNGVTCQIVTVLLKPSVVREDLATIGVIVRCEATGFAGFRLIDPNSGRVSDLDRFFPGYGVANIRQAIAWAEGDIRFALARERQPDGKGTFENLIRPRENVVRYGAPRVALTVDPAAVLDREFRKLVDADEKSSDEKLNDFALENK